MVFDLAFVVPEREFVFQKIITILISTFTSQMTTCLLDMSGCWTEEKGLKSVDEGKGVGGWWMAMGSADIAEVAVDVAVVGLLTAMRMSD